MTTEEMTGADPLGEPDQSSTDGNTVGWVAVGTMSLPDVPGWRYYYSRMTGMLCRVLSTEQLVSSESTIQKVALSDTAELAVIPIRRDVPSVALEGVTAMNASLDPRTLGPVIFTRSVRHRRPPKDPAEEEKPASPTSAPGTNCMTVLFASIFFVLLVVGLVLFTVM
jgi:hypothetical protein